MSSDGVSRRTYERVDTVDRSETPAGSLIVAGVSGGPDSVYLLHKELAGCKGTRVVLGHVNYGTRGSDSDEDQRLVEDLGRSHGMETKVLNMDRGGRSGRSRKTGGNFPAGFEGKARDVRHRFLKALATGSGAGKIAMAHTADDQVETVLMRVFEGAGISGLKGIPRVTGDCIHHPLLHVWKDEILKYLKKHKVPYRIDKSNFDNRFERNWIRNILIPLLVKRYGKAVKERIFTLGERFRELDDYLGIEAGKWIRRNLRSIPVAGGGETIAGKVHSIHFPRKGFSSLPTVLRVKVLQRICFDRLGVVPNGRLLESMDRLVREGGGSSRVNVGNGWELANRYGEAAFAPAGEGGKAGKPSGTPVPATDLTVEERGNVTPAQARRTVAKGDREIFDASALRMPLSVRPLRMGDRVRPFGLGAEKRVKEILIDRKVPREERWGRPAVCDADGNILWIPGVIRSAHAPVTPQTRKTLLLKVMSGMPGGPRPPARSGSRCRK